MKNLNTLLIAVSFFGQSVIGQTVTEIAKAGINSTVSIVSLDNIMQPLGYGSGFIINNEHVVTNMHVIEGSNSAYVIKNGEQKRYTVAGYVAIDKTNDLVILKVTGLNGSELQLADLTLPEIGEKIFAIGNPKGLSGTFSEGIISGVRDLQLNKILQITAPISPGSSGGPVLNSSGQVIGIAFASFTSGQNLNFAIPVKYLIKLKTKVLTTVPISAVKVQQKTTTTKSISPNIKEGISVRNIEPCYSCAPTMIFFSIKNNLALAVSDIIILFLVYDATGTVVDYIEYKFSDEIRPLLAKSVDFGFDAPQVTLKSGYKVKARVLDFKIIEK